MPLIIITGLPSSGKTHRSQQILADFQSRISSNAAAHSPHVPTNVTVQHLQSSHASQDARSVQNERADRLSPATNPRDVIYTSAREEKTARAEEFSAVKRAVSKTNVVIADAPNYIKGFRYQLWCEAKAIGTRSVVVHVAALETECEAWNRNRIEAWKWEDLLRTSNEEDTTQNLTEWAGEKSEQQSVLPESHTAIYGDRVLNQTAEETASSGSANLTGHVSREDVASTTQTLPKATTLMSLYISDRTADTHHDENSTTNGSIVELRPVSLEDGSLEDPVSTASPHLSAHTASLPYSATTIRSLSMRFEPPSPFTRWDTPLFTVPSSDKHPPYQAIWDALFPPPPAKSTKKIVSQPHRDDDDTKQKPEEVRRHAATVLPKTTSAEALQILESATADTVKILLTTARDRGAADGEGGDLTFSVPNAGNGNEIQITVRVPMNTVISQPALQRLRRKYLQIQRGGIAHGYFHVSGRPDIVRGFSKFLAGEWEME